MTVPSPATHGGTLGPAGSLGLQVVRNPRPGRELTKEEIAYYGAPRKGLSNEVNDWRSDNRRNLKRGLDRVLTARRFHIPTHYGQLWLARITPDGGVTDFGLASLRVVTDTGVAFIVDAFQNSKEVENFKYHGLGTGTTSETAAQTGLITELTTQLNPDSTRATGTLTEGATANIFRTVATNTVDSAVAVTEHAVFDQAATGGGTMLDRSVFSAVNLASADSIQSTYELTFASGG